MPVMTVYEDDLFKKPLSIDAFVNLLNTNTFASGKVELSAEGVVTIVSYESNPYNYADIESYDRTKVDALISVLKTIQEQEEAINTKIELTFNFLGD